jgi:hypothetical protein
MVRSRLFPESKTMQATTGSPVDRAASTASRASSRSDIVSTAIPSAPAAASACACSAKASRSAGASTSPDTRSLPLGPIDAKTRARRPAARREIRTPARFTSPTRSTPGCAARAIRFARNVFVRTTRLPAST